MYIIIFLNIFPIFFFFFPFQSVSEEGADRVEIYSDDDEEYSSPEEGSDSEPTMLDEGVSRRLISGRKPRNLGGKSGVTGAAAAARQRNLKQKFVSLLKKFKVTDPEELDHEQANLDQKLSGIIVFCQLIFTKNFVKMN